MKVLKILLPAILVIMLLSPLALPACTLADDGVLVDINITSPWSIISYIALNSPNVTLYLDGVPFQQIVNNAISKATADAIQGSIPNGKYSGVASPGWDGYFGITSNIQEYTLEHKKFSTDIGEMVIAESITLSVYKGAGCGGAWGVADGWPDLWSRRQLIGFLFLIKVQQWNAEDMINQINFLQDKVIILETSDNITKATLERQDIEIQNQLTEAATLKANYGERLLSLEEQNKEILIAVIVIGTIATISIVLALILLVVFFRGNR